jgi:gliding motility-associated-like protein
VPTFLHRYLLVLLGVLHCAFYSFGQNLVPNPGFEDQLHCPNGFNDLVAPPWYDPHPVATSDYYHTCASPATVGIPINYVGNQPAHSGNAYAGIVLHGVDAFWREYLQAPLLEPLVAGQMYHISLYVSLADNHCAIRPLGVLVTESLPVFDEILLFNIFATPQLVNESGYLNDDENWVLLEGCFVAAGGESWITIGNFTPSWVEVMDPDCQHPPSLDLHAYYYVDDVALVEMDPASEYEASIGGPFIDCFEVTVDPDLPGLYYWPDGSFGPTWTTDESGVYEFTVVDECSIGTGTFEVIVEGEIHDLDLGGPITACIEHHIYPQIPGDYIWSNGYTFPFLTVEETGTYSVTITQGCDRYIGSVFVEILDTTHVSIGIDSILLCPGESFTVSLESGIGEYTWNTGSNDEEIEITEAGTYSVTLDDGCVQTADTIVVTSFDPPPAGPLFGPDTLLCDMTSVIVTFDSTAGDFEWHDGSTNSSYVLQESGWYALTISNPCGMSSDEIEVTTLNSPILAPIEDIILCYNNQEETLALDTGPWSYTWNDGTPGETFTVTQPGTYSVTASNACGQLSDSLVVSVIPEMEFSFGDDITICPSQLPIVLDATTPDATDYFWQDASFSPQYTVTQPGAYSVIVFNECQSINETIEIIADTILPVVVLPDDLVVCSNTTVTLSNTGDVGSYQWQDHSTGNTFTVTAEGTYSLTVSNGCGTGSDSVTVSYVDLLPKPDLGPDFSLCPGETFTLVTNHPEAAHLWQDQSTADSIVVTSPGLYYVIISDSCSSVADSVLMTFSNSGPDLDLPEQLALCTGEAIVIDANISGVNFLWEDGSQTSAISVNAPGTYSLTVSNACGSDADSVIVIDAGASPQVELGSDIELCTGETITITPTFTNVDTWLWHDGTSLPAYTISADALLTIQASNTCGIDYDTMQVIVLPSIPLLELGNDTALCPGEQLTLSVDIDDVSITWSTGSQANTIEVSAPGLYYATISNACEANADTIQVDALSAVPDLNLGPDQSLCPGEQIIFNPALDDVDYLWQDGSINESYTASQPGLLILSITNECGISIDSVLIIEDTDGPEIDLGPDIVGCEGESVTVTAGTGGVDYLWHDGSTASSFTTDVSSTVILEVSNACGFDVDTLSIVLSGTAPSIGLGADTMMCEGKTISLIPSIANAISIAWQDGSTTSEFLVTGPGTYSLLATNDCGVDADSVVVSLQFPPAPFSLGPDTTLCLGESIVLSAPDTGDKILWYDGGTDPTIIANEGHVYTVQVSNQCGTQTDAMELTVLDEVPVITLDDHINRCPEEILTLDVTQPIPVTYAWSTGDHSPAITIATPGIYAITIFNECFTVQDEVVVTEDDCDAHIFIPNVFSPNGDNINDAFVVGVSENIEVISMQGSIYDRWGDFVYASEEIPFSWNGYFADQAVNPGVFVYRINVKYRVRNMIREEHVVGDITVIK